MAVTKTIANMIGTSASKTTVADAADETSASVDASTAIGIIIGASVDYGGSADDNVQFEVFTSADDSNYDDTAYVTFEVAFNTSTTVQKTVRIGPEVKYFKVKASNNSSDSADIWAFTVLMQA